MNPKWFLTLGALLLGVGIGWWGASHGRLTRLFAQEPNRTPAQDKPTESPAPTVPAAAPEGDETAGDGQESQGTPLLTLNWLVGSWAEAPKEGQPEGSEGEHGVHFTSQFTTNDAFILRSFTAGKGDEMMAGMQVIAWDPAQETIRSWTFDSDGGFGEGTWRQAGSRYTVRTKYTLPDGGIASSLNILTYISEDAFTWRSVQREIDGALQPDIDEVKLVRVSKQETESEESVAADEAAKEVQPAGAASSDSTGAKQ